ncbi:hypothetical protein Glove_81g68 [Diversispora epigaea]|uniref:Protein kinase domain-containing protein n=1 Tax=Diversispora epigaea TaxID=1348612 RepID=A0A397JCH4_9GLOM|nr:hypothetical protein Glove_81g68 [Diversispora epigaea]
MVWCYNERIGKRNDHKNNDILFEEIVYCPAIHSSNYIISAKITLDISSLDFVEIDPRISNNLYNVYKLQWIPYDNFRDIKHLADAIGLRNLHKNLVHRIVTYMMEIIFHPKFYEETRSQKMRLGIIMYEIATWKTSSAWCPFSSLNSNAIPVSKAIVRDGFHEIRNENNYYVLEFDMEEYLGKSIQNDGNLINVGTEKICYSIDKEINKQRPPQIMDRKEKEEVVYCPAGHSSEDIYDKRKNYIRIDSGYCELCKQEQFSREFRTWSSGNVEIDDVIQESQTNHQRYYEYKLQWIPYNNFRDIEHIADGGYGSVYSAILKNGIKWYWNFNKQDWECDYVCSKVALKEINNSKYDISEFFKEIQNIQIVERQYFITGCFGITKNPSSQNYIIVMKLYDDSLHKFLAKRFLNVKWKRKIYHLYNIASGLSKLHTKKLVHRDLRSGNILIDNRSFLHGASIKDLGLCRLTNDLIDNKSNNIYGSIPYIPPEVLRGNEFTKNGDIYSFGGIMYEMATGKQPFYDRAHDTRLIIDICNGLRPKIPDIIQNYIIVMKLYDDSLHKFLAKRFLNVKWKRKIYHLYNIASGLSKLHTKKLVHRDLRSGNILIDNRSFLHGASIKDLGLCRLTNDLIDNKSNNIYGSIPYIPPEVLRGNEFTKNGDIYSFGGIMYEMATGKQPFYDRAHDTRLIIDICNGLRPKIPDIMLNWVPKWYSDLMYKCWRCTPSERPSANELHDAFSNLKAKLHNNKINDSALQPFKIADENQEKAIKSQKQEFFSSSSEFHPQSCYTSRNIHTLHGLHNSLEDIKSGKCHDPNLLKSTYDIDSKESQDCINWEKEIPNHAIKRSFSTLYCDSQESKECINLDKEDDIILKKLKKRN